ncbi:MAG: eukaryotic-like serine/threonine-protein kinase [Myxococcales bacterium]|jgi:serine/threonine protein kinase|nr:eukaryotic-like serine/threonine-protein kinase [Myxococcales bacterium]
MLTHRPENQSGLSNLSDLSNLIPTGTETIVRSPSPPPTSPPRVAENDNGRLSVACAGAERDLPPLETRYELHDQIARGGMATVYLGRSLVPGKPGVVAIKKLLPHLAESPRFVAMFVDEARLAAHVRHPNVVTPEDLVVHGPDADLCLVMSYVHGETLSRLLGLPDRRQRPTHPSVAAAIMLDVLRGLQAAHVATTSDGRPLGLVHRDVSPQNIMVGVDGRARVLDFGVARARLFEQADGRKERFGKPSYLSPEQIRFQDVDQRTDVFAAGIVLWELLAGQRLFQHDNPRLAWVKILSSPITPPSHFNSAVSAALDAVVLQALQRDRAERFSSARAFAQALAAAVRPAGPRTIAQWVHELRGHKLAQRAAHIDAIVNSPTRLSARWLPVLVAGVQTAKVRVAQWLQRARLVTESLMTSWRRGGRRQRWGVLGLVLILIAGLAPAAKSLPAASVAVGSGPLIFPLTAGMRPVTVPIQPVRSGSVVEPAPAANVRNDVNDGGDIFIEDDHPVTVEAEPVVRRPPMREAAGAEAPLAVTPAKRTAPTTALSRMAVGNIVALQKRALQAYGRGEYESANRMLRLALAQSAAAHLQKHPATASTYVYLGLVMAGGFGQSQLAVAAFRQAIQINPHVFLPPQYATPTIGAAFGEAIRVNGA